MILISHDNRVAYAHAPKSGSRTVLAWLALCEDPDLLTCHPDWFAPSRHKSAGEYRELRKRARLLPADRSHHWETGVLPPVTTPYRIGIYRDPVDRFVSAWRNRLLYHGSAAKHGVATLGEFIARFDEIVATDAELLAHFRPQWQFLGTDKTWFTHLVNLRRIDDLRCLLSALYGVALPVLRLQQSGDVAAVEPSAAERGWIEDRYREDMRLFSTGRLTGVI